MTGTSCPSAAHHQHLDTHDTARHSMAQHGTYHRAAQVIQRSTVPVQRLQLLRLLQRSTDWLQDGMSCQHVRPFPQHGWGRLLPILWLFDRHGSPLYCW